MDRTILEAGLDLSDLLGSALSAGSAELGDLYSAAVKTANAVGSNLLALHGGADRVGVENLPVVGSRSQRSIGSNGQHVNVVADRVSDLTAVKSSLNSRGSAGGVSVLTDDNAAASHQSVGSSAFSNHVEPRVGVLNVHNDLLVNALDTKIESGVTGNDLSIGERTDITDLNTAVLVVVLVGELAGLYELGNLHTGNNTGYVSGLIYAGESVGEVLQTGSLSGIAGHSDKLYIRILLSSLLSVALVTVGVGDDQLAALTYQVVASVFALLILGDVVLPDDLILRKTELFGSALDTQHVSVGVALVLVADENNAQLELGISLYGRSIEIADFGNAALSGSLIDFCGSSVSSGSFVLGSFGVVLASSKSAAYEQNSKDQRKNSLHFSFPP